MDRTIKFRAWDGVGMTMSPSISECHHLASWFEAHSKYLNDKQAVFMQYTGLKDKNGVEIYEGDVLQQFASGLLNWVVVFRDGCFGVQNIHIDGTTNYNEFWRINSPYFFTDREVIGNIYKNPELIS